MYFIPSRIQIWIPVVCLLVVWDLLFSISIEPVCLKITSFFLFTLNQEGSDENFEWEQPRFFIFLHNSPILYNLTIQVLLVADGGWTGLTKVGGRTTAVWFQQ